jgi:uncharacterized protein (TIGR02099 family)
MKRVWRGVEILAWAAFFALAALVLALRFWLLPSIEHYRQGIVTAVSRTVGQPVQIGAIQAGFHGFRPQVTLTDVRILDAQGREALRLPSVENVLSWRSLAAGRLTLRLLAIEGPRLTVRRDASGALHVAGIALSRDESGGALAAWVLDQDEIQVRNAEIEWHDEKRGAPPLALSALGFRLRNHSGRHSVGMTARPPAALGSTLELRAELERRDDSPLDAWSGRVFAELGYTDLAGWRPWIDYPVDVRQGQGALRAWTVLEQGRAAQFTADVELTGVVAQLAPELPLLELAAVSGRLEGARREGGYELAGRRLALVAVRGPAMEPADFRLAWKPDAGAFSAKLVELEPLAQLADALPFPQALRERLVEIAPRGQLHDAKLEWNGDLAAPAWVAGTARFSGLAMNESDGLPRFSGISGSVEARGAKVTATLASRNVELRLPRVFPQPALAFDTLEGQIGWERIGASGYAVRVASLGFANAHLEGRASGTYSNSGAGPGSIDLTAELTRADGAHAERYLPKGEIMGQAVRDYLAGAIRGGQASEVRLRMRGDLARFPFKDAAAGEFQVAARVEKGVFEYAPGWPVLEDIEARLAFERGAMEITGRGTGALGLRLAELKVAVPELDAQAPHLLVSGQVDGPLARFLELAQSRPLQERFGGFADGVSGTGEGKLLLKLDLPIEKPGAVKLAGSFAFSASRLLAQAGLPPIERASGRVSFTESALTVHEGRGQLFGGPLSVTGGSRPGAGVELAAQGEASIAGLQPLLDHPLRRHLDGAAPYTAALSWRGGRAYLRVESSLRGVASALPAPLGKSAAEALPLRVHLSPGTGGRDRVTVFLGRRLRAELLRHRRDGAMAVQRAAVWLSPQGRQQVRIPERPGLLIYGSLPALDMDRWRAALAGDGSSPGTTTFDLKIGTLDAYGKRVRGLSLRGGLDAAGWSATVQAKDLAGDLSYRNEDGGRLVARLKHLNLPVETSGAASASGAAQELELPAVDLVAERLAFNARRLGRIELLARHEGADWRIERLALVNPEARVSGKGLWRTGAEPLTSLTFDLEASDAGKFLGRLGYPGLVRGAKATLQAAVSWKGEPVALDYPTLSGEVELHAQEGQFLEIEPGLGKLISLMSLQALPRRLTLGFRDVFSKGFGFQRIGSAARIEGGVMTLKEFNMQGSGADVEMTGKVDLVHETQDLAVRVLPQLGDTASTVIAIINPVLFFPAAIAQRILKDPLGHIFSFTYAVTGSWADPNVERTGVAAQPIDGTPTY